MKNLLLQYVGIVLLFFINTMGTLGQDSSSHLLNIVSKDSSQIIPDSLRRDLRNLNFEYLHNIHVNDINKVLAEFHPQQKYKYKNGQPIPGDSLKVVNELINSDISQLKSIKSSLQNYLYSISNSKSSLQQVVEKHQLNNVKYPLIFAEINKRQLQLQLKQDSIEHSFKNVESLISLHQAHLQSLGVTLNTKSTDSIRTTNSIWKSTSHNLSREVLIDNIKNNFQSRNTFSRYFQDIPWNSRILLLLLTIAYAYWCFRTRFDIDKKGGKSISRNWIFKVVCKAVIFYFTLLPLVSLFTPTFIIQVAQIIIIILYLALAFGKLSLTQKKILIGIILFYILVVFVNMIVSDDIFLRIVCIFFNVLALVMVTYSKKRIKAKDAAGYINNFIYAIFVVLNLSAIILNIIGKVDISRSFSIACAVGLVQSFTLQFFVEMFRDDLQRQFERDTIYKGFWTRFNRRRLVKIVLEIVRLMCVILAILVLANNLQFIDSLVTFATNVLEKKRSLGSITFTFSHLIIAVLLLILTHWFQKNISLIIFGGEDGQLSQKYNQKMTLFPLIRLAIILVGFFFAVSALGMSLDKLTVIIGALSVGIGLGMQNIINNFVSGIILVFDKPFRVGDQIELADKKGRVKEIGIRASVLQTGDGADVIIPNGDLLSGRLVNWTLSTEHSKTSFTIMIDKQSDLERVQEWINEAAEKSPYYLKVYGVSMSIKDVSQDMIYLNIVAWVNTAADAAPFKSSFFLDLYKKFAQEDLKFYSVV